MMRFPVDAGMGAEASLASGASTARLAEAMGAPPTGGAELR